MCYKSKFYFYLILGRVVGKHGHEIREVNDKSLVKIISKDNEKEIAVRLY